MNIIILSKKDQIDKKKFKIDDERFLHIKDILKSGLDDIIEIGILNGQLGKAKIVSLSENEIFLEIISLEELKIFSNTIDLICALPRPQTLKKVLSISATMGVENLYLIRSEKVEKSYFHSPLLKAENYTKFLIEGLSQGKRTKLPTVTIHPLFKKFFKADIPNFNSYNIKLLAHPNSENNLTKFELSKKKKILVAIGPEGGWNEFEICFMTQHNFQAFKLSENILRVENAVTAVLSQIEMLLMN